MQLGVDMLSDLTSNEKATIAVSVLGAIFMGFTIIDSLAWMFAGASLAEIFFGNGSSIAGAVMEHVPGMSAVEFVAVNCVALVIISLIFVVCLYYMLPAKSSEGCKK